MLQLAVTKSAQLAIRLNTRYTSVQVIIHRKFRRLQERGKRSNFYANASTGDCLVSAGHDLAEISVLFTWKFSL